ncbi:MAG: DUF4440 domain-containing protein [Verrucomicrobiota bacterium]
MNHRTPILNLTASGLFPGAGVSAKRGEFLACWTALSLFWLSTVGCQAPRTARAASAWETNPSPGTPAAEVLEADRAFARMSVEQGASRAFLAWLAEDVVMLQPGRPPIHGRLGVQEHFADFPNAARLNWKPVAVMVAQSGDLATTFGFWEFAAPGPDGAPRASHGKYLTVWRRDAHGSWKVILDGGHEDPPIE